MHFNKMHILSGTININIQDCSIKSSPLVKFLSIHLGFELTFEYYINHLVSKCSKALNTVKFLCGSWWGSDPETLVIIYKSYIRSIIDYCSYIYYSRKATSKKKLKLVPIIHWTKYLCDDYLSKVMSNSGSLSYKCIWD